MHPAAFQRTDDLGASVGSIPDPHIVIQIVRRQDTLRGLPARRARCYPGKMKLVVFADPVTGRTVKAGR